MRGVRNNRLVWSGGAIAAVVSVLVAALAVFGLPSAQQRSKHAAAAGFAISDGTVPLWPVPAAVLQACRQAQAHASFVVLCPSRLPRATRDVPPWEPPSALQVTELSENLDFSYNAPEAGVGPTRTPGA
jgi:hypothetical protein